MKHLIKNAVICNLCKDTIQSYYGHDYKHCKCGNAMVDGGLEYARYGWEKDNSITLLHIYMEDVPFSIIRKHFCRWNSRTKEYIKLMDISNGWLDSIVSYYLPTSPIKVARMQDEYLLLYIQEKLYRAEQE